MMVFLLKKACMYDNQGRIQSWTLGGGRNCLFQMKGFLTLLFAIGNIAAW